MLRVPIDARLVSPQPCSETLFYASFSILLGKACRLPVQTAAHTRPSAVDIRVQCISQRFHPAC